MITRRDLLKLAPAAILSTTSKASAQKLHRLPILQTLTTNSTTQLIITKTKQSQLSYAVRKKNSQVHFYVQPQQVFDLGEDEVQWLFIDQLEVGVEYELFVYDGAELIDHRFFKTLDLSKTQARLSIASCMHDGRIVSQKLMWSRVRNSKPNLMFWVGDCVYADLFSDSSPADLLKRHLQTRRRLDAFKFQNLIPTMSVWDNHDFGIDAGAGIGFPNKKASLELFWIFFGSETFGNAEREKHFSKGPGCASYFSAFQQNFFLMDDRYFREARSESGEHWGSEQTEWMLENSRLRPFTNWLMNGSQFFGGYRKISESFERDHPQAFSQVLSSLSELNQKSLFVSGDVHFSEVMKIEKDRMGYETFELTSSSIHSFSFPGNDFIKKNPRRIEAANFLNFLSVDLEQTNVTQLKIRCVGMFFNYFNVHISL